MGHMLSESTLPDDYPQLLDRLKTAVRTSRASAQRTVNTALLRLYWTIGRTIVTEQDKRGWGAKVVEQLATDLRREFPDMTGLSRSNLMYMRQFAAAWPSEGFVQQPVGQMPWGHVTVLLGKLDDPATRNWYAAAAVEHGWSRAVLLNQIKNQTHARVGAAPSNFTAALSAPQSELAQQLAKDPYVFDFLGLAGQVAERDLEDALMNKLQQTLLELGRGFAFVGRQVHLDIDGDDFYIDLLFFHVEQLRYVVVELKIDRFKPEYAGKLGFYIAAVDDIYRREHHAPTVGILLCADRSERVVRYSLGNTRHPMAVSTYTYDSLPAEERAALPAAADVIDAVERGVEVHGEQLTLAEYFSRVETT